MASAPAGFAARAAALAPSFAAECVAARTSFNFVIATWVLEQRARAMRFSPTGSEEWLWRRLSGSKTGFAFRRQLVIGPHIVNFACTRVRLVVEVDGPYHGERPPPDTARDAALAKRGWHVARAGS